MPRPHPSPAPPSVPLCTALEDSVQRPATSARLSRARFERLDFIHEKLLICQNTIKLKTKDIIV